MKKEDKYALAKLEKAWGQLSAGVKNARKELERDGVIQRFEFSFELLWKTLKVFLQNRGVDARTPKDCLKEAFRLGWLDEERVFMDMLEDRNMTSHIYEKSAAMEIYKRIKGLYLKAIAGVIHNLRQLKSK